MRMLLAATALSLTAVATLAPLAANAAPAMPYSEKPGASLVQKVQGWRYCRIQRRECAERWGWGTRRFRWCVARHGC